VKVCISAKANACFSVRLGPKSSEPPAWLRGVYERRRRRTVHLVELSIAALQRAAKRTSLAADAHILKTVDLEESKGISESAILHNEEAYALYHRHADHKRQTVHKPSPNRRIDIGDDNRIRVSADRDRGRARQRYLRASKADLVERLLGAEQAYAEMESRWLKTADDLLAWILVVDRLVAREARTSLREDPPAGVLDCNALCANVAIAYHGEYCAWSEVNGPTWHRGIRE